MRITKESNEFKRCFRRALKGKYRDVLTSETGLRRVLRLLANDEQLEYSYHDHPLIGEWLGSRECHLKPDFLLIYRYEGDDILRLERLGSHSEIFGL